MNHLYTVPSWQVEAAVTEASLHQPHSWNHLSIVPNVPGLSSMTFLCCSEV